MARPAPRIAKFAAVRAIGLDVGDKTVGIAASDELGITAQGLPTLRRTNLRADLAALLEVAREREATHFVVGLPLNMDGSEGPRAEVSRKLGDALGEASGLVVAYWDERLTTAAAQRVLLEADVSRAKRRQVVDKLAAQLILQGWLDARGGSPGDL
jgi:putative Holliday junction resolvase